MKNYKDERINGEQKKAWMTDEIEEKYKLSRQLYENGNLKNTRFSTQNIVYGIEFRDTEE